MRSYINACLGICLAAGCTRSTRPADIGEVDTPYLQKGRVQWNNSNMQHLLDVEKVVAERTEAGLLRIRMVLRNKTANDIFVDIQTIFTDETGFEKEQTNWEPICCVARTQSTYTITSLGAGVHDYRIVIRDPRRFQGMAS